MRQFFCEIKESFVELKLKTVSKSILGRKEKFDQLSNWDGLSRFDQIEALGNLFAEIDENPESCSKLEGGDGYRLSFDFVSRLTEAQAITFGMPSSFPHAIQIKTHSNIGSKNYSVDWDAFGNNRKLNVSRTGCFLKLGTQYYRISNSIWLIVECIDNFNSKQTSSFDEKAAFVAELKSLLPDTSDASVQFEGELASISLQHAVAFSLQITGDKNSVNFNPVLFNKIIKEKAADSDGLIEEDEQALSPNDARSFAASFNKTNSVQSSYLLGPGNYVFVDPSLRPALNVVKAARKFDKESRVEFAKAPQKFIKNALAQQLEGLSDIDLEITAANIDRIFIETRQFSDRVTEMGVWQAPELPWLETEPQDWRSDNYAFYVQGKTVTVPNSELEQAVKGMEAALSSGATTVEIGGQIISPDLSFLEFLKSLIPEKPKVPDDDPPPSPPPSPKEGPFVLLTKENFESVQYNSRLSPRTTPLDPRPPECKSDSIILKKHQKIGVDWLVETYNRGFPGVLVADDMGLGKTLQALMFLAIMVESGKTESGEPILIVAPVGLLKNWEEEHEKHLKSPGLGSFAKLYGNGL
jgi:SNF2 family DNA or RNA helicase